MKQIRELYKRVRETHQGLEKPLLITLLTILGGRGVWLIGFPGSGKTTIGISICKMLKPHIEVVAKRIITKFGLLVDSSFLRKRIFVYVDDYAVSPTEYLRSELLTGLCTANTTKTLEYSTRTLTREVVWDEFNYLINIQPIWLNFIFRSAHFTNLLQSKVTRVYIFNKAKKKNKESIDFKLKLYKIDKAKYDLERFKDDIKKLEKLYSPERADEVVEALIKGIVKLEGEISDEHYELIKKMIEYIALEDEFIIQKSEYGYSFNINLFRLTNMFSKYETFTLEEFCREFRLKESFAEAKALRSLDVKLCIYKNNDKYHLVEGSKVYNYLQIINKPWF